MNSQQVVEAPHVSQEQNAQDHPPSEKKKKMRYSKEQKRERKAQLAYQQPQSPDVSQPSSPTNNEDGKKRQKKDQEQLLSLNDQVIKCARESAYTVSTAIDHSDDSRAIRIVTTCSLHESRNRFPPASELYTVRVQPLLILDLNGVLCHRSREYKEPAGVQLRPPVGCIAGTPIIPRYDLADFLHMLEQYFCLAIWTSAKRKTARGILDMLVPPSMQRRFLFVWTQNECNAVRTDGVENEIVFEKLLHRVWKAYPLWNADNTLIMDDSPDKCPYAHANAIHPAPIHGQWRPPFDPNDADFNDSLGRRQHHEQWRSDTANERCQYDFFQEFIHYWMVHPHQRLLNNDNVLREDMSNDTLYQHLERYGSGNMGWRGGDKNENMPSWNSSFSNSACPTRRGRDLWTDQHDR